MKLSELETLGRALVPGAKTGVINQVIFRKIINEGAIDVAFYTRALKKSKTFNVVANSQEYSLSENVSDYLIIDDTPLKWNDGTNYKPLDPTTKNKLDYDKPSWRGSAASSPKSYFIEGDSIWTDVKASTSVTNGFWIDYAAKPQTMSDDNHYPFHKDGDQTVEIPHLSKLSMNILDYWIWKALIIISKNSNEIIEAREIYYDNLGVPKHMRSNITLLNWRPDMERFEETNFSAKDFRC